ncbi:MAG: hypothetical protein CW338_09625 [Clostridiales bacterium]|nr:hypothetical protein [Clostridiales bacterium]
MLARENRRKNALNGSVTDLYPAEEALRCGRKEKLLKRVCAITAAAALTACIMLCCLVNTKNAGVLAPVIIGVSAAGGCVCVCLYMHGIRPAKAMRTHAEGLKEAEKETLEGILLPERELFSIPKSVTVCRVRLQGDGETVHKLSIRADREQLLPAPGSLLRAETARRYITALEVLREGGAAGETAAPAKEKRKKRERRAAKLKRCLSPLMPMLLVIILSAVLWGWIFTLITDTAADRKITLYTTASIADQTALSVQLEDWARADGTENIRMAQAREFTYFMFGGDALAAGDLFIIRESELDDYIGWFVSLPAEFRDLPGATYIDNGHGTPVGIRLRTPDDENGALKHLSLADGDWYLFFGKESLHLEGNRDAVDNCAADTARHLLNME